MIYPSNLIFLSDAKICVTLLAFREYFLTLPLNRVSKYIIYNSLIKVRIMVRKGLEMG